MENPKLIEEALIDMIDVLDDDAKVDAYIEKHKMAVIEEAFRLIEEKGPKEYAKAKGTSLYQKTVGQALSRANKKIDRGVSGVAQKVLSKVPGSSGDIVEASKHVTLWVAGVFAGIPNLKNQPKL